MKRACMSTNTAKNSDLHTCGNRHKHTQAAGNDRRQRSETAATEQGCMHACRMLRRRWGGGSPTHRWQRTGDEESEEEDVIVVTPQEERGDAEVHGEQGQPRADGQEAAVLPEGELVLYDLVAP